MRLVYLLLSCVLFTSVYYIQYKKEIIQQVHVLPTVEDGRGLKLSKQVTVANSKRTALVIGNSAYGGGDSLGPLKNPVNDATDLAAKLKKLNFDLVNNVPLLNANKQQIEQAVKTFTTELKQGNLGLFFYAGHGMQIDGVNYLLPLGSNFKSKADVKYNAVNLDWVLAELESAKNPINFILLDACRDNPFLGFRSSSKGLAESRAPEGSLISFSTGPGKVAADGFENRNSPYTQALLKALDKPGMEVLSLFKSVRRNVKKITYNQQTPWESHSLTEDIYFNGSLKDRVSDQQNMLQQLAEIRKQQQTTNQQLQQAIKQQQEARSNVQKQQASNALKRARTAAEKIRSQAKKIGVIINPSALEEDGMDAFAEALTIQNQAFIIATNQREDSEEYDKAEVKHTSDAYLNYLKNCNSPCAYSKHAESAYKNLQSKLDTEAYQQATIKSDPKSYQYYLENCNIICAYQEQAQQNLKISTQIEQDIKLDNEFYKRAMKIGTTPALAAYLYSCEICLDTSKIKTHWNKDVISQLPYEALQEVEHYNDQMQQVEY